jgi:nitrite reductase (NO-forming)
VIPEAGQYVLVDHEFADAHHGALGAIDASLGKGLPAEEAPKPKTEAPPSATFPSPTVPERKPAPSPEASPRVVPAKPEPTPLQEMPGALLFKTKNCYTCHTIGKGKMVGPDLKGLFSRREEAWLHRYILKPTEMTKTDPIAMQLKQEYKSQMPDPVLTSKELEELIAYLKEATK